MMDPREGQQADRSTLNLADFSAPVPNDEAPTIETIPSSQRRSSFVAARLTQLRNGAFVSQLRSFQPPPLTRRRMFTLGILTILLVSVALVIISQLPPQLQYASAKQSNLTLTYTTSGTLQSANYDANFAASGKVAELDVKVGDTVTSGQTLAKLDTTLLADAVAQAQAAVSAAQTALDNAQNYQSKAQAQAQAEANAAYSQEQQQIAICDNASQTPSSQRGSCEQAAMDAYAAAQAKADSESAAAQLAVSSAQTQLSQAQAQLQIAQDNLGNATLNAPHDGLVTAVNGSIGSVVTTTVNGNGATVVTPFITIADLTALQAHATVDARHVGATSKGQVADLVIPAINAHVRGTVESISPVGALSDGVLRYPLLISIDPASNSGFTLLPGMSATVVVTTQQHLGVIVVPARAVYFARAAADRAHGGFLSAALVSAADSKARLLIAQAQDTGADTGALTPGFLLGGSYDHWRLIPVLLGSTDGANYEVAQGLTSGSRVVVGEAYILGLRGAPSNATPTLAPNR